MSNQLDSNTGLEYRIKQPAESRKYTMDFTPLLGSNIVSTIVGVAGVNLGRIEGSEDIIVGSPTTDGASLIQVRIEAGTHREDYKITATITDNGGNTLQGEGVIKVRDL